MAKVVDATRELLEIQAKLRVALAKNYAGSLPNFLAEAERSIAKGLVWLSTVEQQAPLQYGAEPQKYYYPVIRPGARW